MKGSALLLLLAAGCGQGSLPPDSDMSMPDLTVVDLSMPTCDDGKQNGVETDTDCGGGTCPACALGRMCLMGSDCMSGICTGGHCSLPMALTFSLSAPTPLPVGAGPSGLAAGDIDNDGILDLVVSDTDGSSLSLLVGKGASGWKPAINYPAGGISPVGVALPDLDRDGNIDVVLACKGSNNLSILLNQGGGLLHVDSNQPGYSQPLWVASADLDGDMKPDLAAANQLGVEVVLAGKNSQFQQSFLLPTGQDPRAVIIVDMNDDQKLDLVACNAGTGDVSVLLAQGGGGFHTSVNFSAGTTPAGLAAGDLDGDGKLDIATANSTSNDVGILLNQGGGLLQGATHQPAGMHPSGIVITDLDLDGRPDIAVSNASDATVTVLLNTGGGTFKATQPWPAGNGPAAIVAGDWNGDGKNDLAVADYTAGTVSILLNTSM